ncbi:hypothetical protein [Methanobrevibacter sp.]|uniref:hypothetical protein n=1 Tax=Methanobrevibacter sp. TaxID=66852 RepID=UPI00386E7AC9
MVLTIEEILNGVEDYKEIYLESLEDTVFLRPLSKGEWEKTNSIRQESLGDYVTNEKAQAVSRNQRVSNIESQLKFNIKQNADADFKAQVEAIFISCDNPGNEKPPKRTDIEKLPAGIFDEMYEKVKELTGIDDDVVLEDDVEDFPEN